jgi:hypothetical protein
MVAPCARAHANNSCRSVQQIFGELANERDEITAGLLK